MTKIEQGNNFFDNVKECEEDEIWCTKKKHHDKSEKSLDDVEGNWEDDNHVGRIEADFSIPKFISSFVGNTVIYITVCNLNSTREIFLLSRNLVVINAMQETITLGC